MRIMYLNIDSDTTSRDLTEAELARVGIKAERVPAITGDNRPLAFNQSVYKAMGLAEGGDLLLMEDDVMFDTNVIDFVIPPNAMSVHLGMNIIGADTTVWQMPTNYIHSGLKRVWNGWQSHCSYYSAECVRYILDNFKYVTDEYKTEGCQIFDEWFRVNIMPMGRSYITDPLIAYQRPRKSEIWNCQADYRGCHAQGNNWLKNNP